MNTIKSMNRSAYIIGILLSLITLVCVGRSQASDEVRVIETPDAIEIHTAAPAATTATTAAPASTATAVAAPAAAGTAAPQAAPASTASGSTEATEPALDAKQFDPLKYTLGPDDVVEISVMRHPEFSGTYAINQEGKLQYKFVGDIIVNGMNKTQLEQKIREVISAYVISPEVNVTVTDYKSKIFYVLGEVGGPGKYYMRSESMSVREAVFLAGLPTQTAAMRKCQIITPDNSGQPKIRNVDLYAVLYGGNLRKNIDMHPGDVLYVPSTVMAKIVRIISPVTTTIGVASGVPSSATTGRSSIQSLVTK